MRFEVQNSMILRGMIAGRLENRRGFLSLRCAKLSEFAFISLGFLLISDHRARLPLW
jgi:hypothetical protein